MLRFALILCIGFVVIFTLFLAGAVSFSGVFDKKVTYKEAVDNFTTHQQDILYFTDLLHAQRPAGHEISFGVEGNKASISLGMPGWSVDQRFPNQHFDCSISSVDNDAPVLKATGWNVATFNNMVAAFRKTKCQSAQTDGGDISIAYKSGTWNSYSYRVLEKPIADSLKTIYDSLKVNILNNRTILSSAWAL